MDTIEFLYSIIGYPLGYIMWAIYEVICKNTGASIGVAILVFTFIVKLAMLPLSIRQQKNTAKSAIFAPKVREIQQKYKNNQEKQQQELAKLQQQGYSPMGGCGTMAITFLLLFGVLDVVYKPMTHIMHMGNTAQIMQESYYVSMTKIFVDEYGNTQELTGEALTKHDEIVRDAKQILEFYNANCLGDGEEPLTEDVWANLDATSKNMVKKVVTKATLTSFNEDNGNDLFTESDLYSLTKAEQAEVDAIGDETEKNEYRQAHSFSASTRSAVETVQRKYGSVKATADSDTLTYTQASTLQRELYAIEMYGQVSEIDPTASAYSLQQSDKDNMAELNDKLEFRGSALCKGLQSFAALVAVAVAVDGDAAVGFLGAVACENSQILEAVKSLAASADNYAELIAGNVKNNVSVAADSVYLEVLKTKSVKHVGKVLLRCLHLCAALDVEILGKLRYILFALVLKGSRRRLLCMGLL